jgi:hypothetical protein
MKVFDLQCTFQHTFEGWFGSDDDFTRQHARGLVSCPVCGDTTVHKMLSAPRLNLKSGKAPASNDVSASDEAPAAAAESVADPSLKEIQGHWMRAVRAVLANTEDVGDRFADQARAMHHGDMEPRNIRGQTSPEVALALVEEGIEVMPLPALQGLKETLQ